MPLNKILPITTGLGASRGVGLASLICLAACGSPASQAVTVTVDKSQVSLDRVHGLQVGGTLNDKEATNGKQAVALDMLPFTLIVNRDLSGPLHVVVSGLSLTQEVLMQGEGEVTLTGTGEYSLTITLHKVVPDSAALSFAKAVFYGSGVSSVLASGDLSGDGQPDLLTTPQSLSAVSVLLNQGAGTFSQSLLNSDTGLSVYSLALSDVNGDGKLDAVIADVERGAVSWLAGKGSGSLGPPATVIPTLGSARVLAAADVNADKIPDLVLGYGKGVMVLHGKGDGTFTSSQDIALGDQVFAGVLGDLNEDGSPDLAVLHGSGVRVLFGKGDGTFAEGSDLPSLHGLYQSIAVSDRDLALVDGQLGTVSLLAGDGAGTFKTAPSSMTGGLATTVVSADVNADSIPDFLFVNGSGTVSVLLANGDGTFQDARSFPAGVSPVNLTALDANGDGKTDLAVVATEQTEGPQRVGVLLNTSP